MVKTELEWYTVKEKLPEDKEFVLVCYQSSTIWYDYVWFNKTDNVFEHSDFNIPLKNVIAWTRLSKEEILCGQR